MRFDSEVVRRSLQERIVEPFPEHMLRKAQQTAGKNYVTVDSRGSPRLRWPEGALSQSSRDRVQRCRPLEVRTPFHGR